jgi:hypothetical protein
MMSQYLPGLKIDHTLVCSQHRRTLSRHPRNVVGFKADTKLSQPYQMTNRDLAIYLVSDFSGIEPSSVCRRQGKRESAQGAGFEIPDPKISDIVNFMSKHNEVAESSRFLLPYPESCRIVQLACGSID